MEKSGQGGPAMRIEAPQPATLRQLVISGAALAATTSERLQFQFNIAAIKAQCGPWGHGARLQHAVARLSVLELTTLRIGGGWPVTERTSKTCKLP